MHYRGNCAHCGKEGKKFERSRRSGRAIPRNSQHRFNVTRLNNKICSNCYTTIHNNPRTPCDFCRERFPAGALSDVLLIAADAARQQNQILSTLIPISTPTLTPVTSSEILPARRRTAIRRYEEARLAELAKKRSADVVRRTNTREYVRKRQRAAGGNQSARAASGSRKVRKVSAAPAPLVTVPPAPQADNSARADGNDENMYDKKYDE